VASVSTILISLAEVPGEHGSCFSARPPHSVSANASATPYWVRRAAAGAVWARWSGGWCGGAARGGPLQAAHGSDHRRSPGVAADSVVGLREGRRQAVVGLTLHSPLSCIKLGENPAVHAAPANVSICADLLAAALRSGKRHVRGRAVPILQSAGLPSDTTRPSLQLALSWPLPPHLSRAPPPSAPTRRTWRTPVTRPPYTQWRADGSSTTPRPRQSIAAPLRCAAPPLAPGPCPHCDPSRRPPPRTHANPLNRRPDLVSDPPPRGWRCRGGPRPPPPPGGGGWRCRTPPPPPLLFGPHTQPPGPLLPPPAPDDLGEDEPPLYPEESEEYDPAVR
jgi:hypothetical protein